jgi:hypothetical protein
MSWIQLPSSKSKTVASKIKKLVIRPARRADRGAILAMSKEIWGGTDYLHLVWDRWFADPNGGLLTITLDGKPVGASKITLLAPREVWFEGLRLHPRLHGRGLTKQINRYSFQVAAKHHPRSIRYSTGAGNAASRHLGETRGFWLIARAQWMWGKARKRGGLNARPAQLRELPAVFRFITASDCYKATGGIYGLGWSFPELTQTRVRDLITKKRVLRYPKQGRLTAVAIYDIGLIDDDVCLGFVDGPDSQIGALARDVLRIAGERGDDDASAMLPDGRHADLAFKAGFNMVEPAPAVVYELGARGFSGSGESFEETMWRALYSREEDIADALTDLLAGSVSRELAEQNVRDFVTRHLLPGTQKDAYGKLEILTTKLRTYELRNIARATFEHFMTEYGMVGEFVRFGKTAVSFMYCGKKIASMRVNSRSFDLTLGPGAGPCFPRGFNPPVDSVRLDERHFHPGTKMYESVTLRISKEEHRPSAELAIDMLMRRALGDGA